MPSINPHDFIDFLAALTNFISLTVIFVAKKSGLYQLKADEPWADFKTARGATFCDGVTLGNRLYSLKFLLI